VKEAPTIFLSYARQDRKGIEALYKRLSNAGFKPWMDKDILPGERWENRIQQAMRSADFFLACLTANSVDKRGFLQKEIKFALDIAKEMLDEDIYIIPLRLEDCTVPDSLSGFQWVDFFEETGWPQLVKALQVGMERRTKVTKPDIPNSTIPIKPDSSMETDTIDVFSKMPAFDDSQKDLTGKTISHYKILRKLGEGGIGVVYLAEDINLGHQVAIKFLRDEYANDPSLNERFRLEAKVLLKLAHENIVRFFEFAKYQIAEGQHKFYIVMEYVEGYSLREKLAAQKGALSIQQEFEIIIPVCEGLRVAHQKGITHRDIKPENILIDKQGTLKISDFGLAKLKGGTLISLGGFPIGTPAYMSPEQTEAKELDQRSDIFSLGIVLYELITRQQPFNGGSLQEVYDAIRNKRPNPLTQYRKDIPEGLQKILDKALAKTPRQRYQNIDKLLEDVNSLLAQKHKEKKNWRAVARYLIPIGVVIAGIIGFIMDATELFDRLKNFSNQPSTVSMFTEPAGAVVFLNGDSIGITPIKNYSSPMGTVSVRFKKAGYPTFDTLIAVNKVTNLQLNLTLKKADVSSPDFVQARIFSEPTGATVFLNGKPIGVTQLNFSARHNSRVKLRLQKPEYFPVDTAFVIRKGQDSTFSFALKPAARVSIKANPATAEFRLDGKFTPWARLVDAMLSVGPHRIEISAKGYTSIKDSFNLSQGFNKERAYTLNKIVAPLSPRPVVGSGDSTSKPNARLTPRVGTLQVLVLPFGSIYIDGKLQKEDWDRQFKTELAVGAYLLKATHPQFGTWEKQITIEGEKLRDIPIDFNKMVKLKITATPVDGEIFVDGASKGYTPKELRLRIGQHRLEVRRKGYVGETQIINLEEERKIPILFTLAKTE